MKNLIFVVALLATSSSAFADNRSACENKAITTTIQAAVKMINIDALVGIDLANVFYASPNILVVQLDTRFNAIDNGKAWVQTVTNNYEVQVYASKSKCLIGTPKMKVD